MRFTRILRILLPFYLLNTVEAKVGNLQPSKSKSIKLPVVFPSDLPEEEYMIQVVLGDEKLPIEDCDVAC